MPANSSATEIAFLIVAVIHGVFAVILALGAWWVGSARPALAHWATWSGLGTITWTILAAHFDSPPLIGILIGVLMAVVLQRGIRVFIGREQRYAVHVAAIIAVIIASTLPEESRYIEATINFATLSALYAYITRDLYLHARDDLHFRFPVVLCLPVLLGAAGFGARAIQALTRPESVLTEMAANSELNLNAAIFYIVLVLALHATLVALVVGRLTDELRKLSLHDGLTGLLNRRAMEETLQTQIRSSRRSGYSFVVMMLDLDYFKRINDEFGHAVGDLALKHVSTLLGSALRDIDVLARFGGEEFVALLPEVNLLQAEPVAERLRGLLASSPLMQDETRVTLSVSIGIAEWNGHEDNQSLLLRRADAALFQAKVQGRNRVVASPRGVAVGVLSGAQS
jgi:diguanylate cyclase (GGDEF)-like protein